MYSPGGWRFAYQLTNGSGQFTGSGETADSGGDGGGTVPAPGR
ncbi:MAG: hypothetical protein SGJ09_00405 [Phycisphaerae bacterium]|nr:hypothetical protein [Phycisphaerae bacterium]